MNIQLENKPDFELCLNRIEAWFNQEINLRPHDTASRH